MYFVVEPQNFCSFCKELGLEPGVDPKFLDELAKTTDFTKVDAKIDELLAFGAPRSQLQKFNSVLRQINTKISFSLLRFDWWM